MIRWRVCFASPLGKGERIEVRGSGPRAGYLSEETLTLTLSLAKGEATILQATPGKTTQALPSRRRLGPGVHKRVIRDW